MPLLHPSVVVAASPFCFYVDPYYYSMMSSYHAMCYGVPGLVPMPRMDLATTSPVTYKTEKCKLPKCAQGVECHYFHSSADMRTRALNEKEGLTTPEALDAFKAQIRSERNCQ